MNLEELRSKNFDDILYAGVFELRKRQALPQQLARLDEPFLQNVFELYRYMEDNHIGFVRNVENTGFSTALYFVVFYYSLFTKNITILGKPSQIESSLEVVFRMIMSFVSIDLRLNLMSNQMIINDDKGQVCTIKILNSGAFDIAELSAYTFFDNCNKLSNYDQMRDVMLNAEDGKYDRLMLNFPKPKKKGSLAEDDLFLKLGQEFNFPIMDFKIF